MTVPTVRLEVAFTADASLGDLLHLDDATRGKLDTGTLSGGAEFLTIPANDLRSFTTKRGATRVESPVIRYEAGTLSAVLKDASRNYDPDNLAGPYVSAGITQVTPGRAVRVIAEHASIAYDLWRGSADNWEHDYFPPSYAEVTLTATDGFGVLGQADRTAVGAAGANEDTGARISRILDSAAWPALDRDIATGDSLLAATTLEGNALSELYAAADAEVGELYMDPQGRVYFRNRLALLTDARSNTVQATFSAPVGADLPFQVAPPAYDREQLANTAIIARDGGAEQTSTDTTSKNTYGPATFRRTDLPLPDDTAALDYAGYIVALGKDPERRFAELVLWPEKAPATLYPHALGRRIGDRIAISLQPPGGGTPITRECFIRGITHSMQAAWWETRWTLQSATRYSFLLLDHATLGKLDQNALSY
ncbi:MAG TPA: hypothetical protein VG276_28700 [Actinomycetes bacterium]|jgi:hypothetical protein|nr:hypothetical protein [Actinomycetes bacterium]